jgi:ketosteroid isomerase-like protein
MSIEENKKFAQKFLDALSRGDWQFVEDAYADDVVIWTAGSLPFSGTQSKEGISDVKEFLTGSFPEGLKFTVKAMTAEGERVAIEAESYGKHISGKIYNNLYHFLMVIRDGQIYELKEYMDTMHANDVLMSGPE